MEEVSGFACGYAVTCIILSQWSRMKPGAPKGTRTPNLLIRSQMLYPIELSAQTKGRRLCHKGVFGASLEMNPED